MSQLKKIWDVSFREKSVAWSITVMFHLLLLLIMFSFTLKQPQLEEEPIEYFEVELDEENVMQGVDQIGSGDGENIDPSTGASAPRVNDVQAPNGARQNPTVHAPRNNTNSPRTSGATPTNTNRPTANPASGETRSSTSGASGTEGNSDRAKAVFGSRNRGSGVGNGSGSGQGNGPGSGIQGTPSGSMNYSLGDRSLVSRPNRYGKFSKNGKVRIAIYVDRSGRIVRHRILSSTSSELSSLATQKLSEIKFNSSSSAPPEQQGTITFNFQLI